MSSPFPCPNPPSQCETNPNPLTSFSSEAVDSTTFIGLAWAGQLPSLNKPFTVYPCEGIADSQVSQSDADIKATNLAVVCANPCSPSFANTAQTATGTCPNGSTYSLTIPAGIFLADNQVLADRKALTAAVAALRGHSICLGSLAPTSVCRGEFYFGIITVITTDVPSSIILLSGELLEGLSLTFESDRAVVQGIPISFGTAHFILQATSAAGVVTIQGYSLFVTGIVTDSVLLGATTGTPYSTQLTAVVPAGASAVWSVTAGALPDGLSLNADTGEISGTPTTAGDSNFTVSVTADGATCSKDFSITTTSSSDICTDGIAALLPNTYAIDGYFDGLIDNSSSAPSGNPLWDGTFIFSMGDGFPDDGTTGWFSGGLSNLFSIQNRQACSATIVFLGCVDAVPQWRLSVNNINDIPLWQGDKFGGQTPEGVYSYIGGIDAGPAALSIILSGVGSIPSTPPSCSS